MTIQSNLDHSFLSSRSAVGREWMNSSFLDNHVLPKWGDMEIQDLQPRPVELWLRKVPLSPKSKTHVRSLMYGLIEFTMWAGILDINRNPMSLVQNKGATHRTRKPRSLTVEQFQSLLKELREPFATMALVSVCLGLRISETLALRWSDINWLDSQLNVERGIVNQIVDEVKMAGSAKIFDLTPELLGRLKSLKQSSDFSTMRTGYSPAHTSLVDDPTRIREFGVSLNGPGRLLNSANLGRRRSAIPIGLGLTLWEQRSPCSRR